MPYPLHIIRQRVGEVDQWRPADIVANDKEQQRFLPAARARACARTAAKKPEVDLEDGLEQAHVGALVQPDLVLPIGRASDQLGVWI